MRKSVLKIVSIGMLLVFCSVTRAFAQVDTATIVGTVKDASGAVIPGASITATEVNTGIRTEVKSGADGNYVITPLKIGAYSLTVDAKGFQKVVRQNIVLNVQAGVRVDFSLQVGSVTQTVEVSGAPPLVQTTDASLGSVVGSQQVEQLPLNGRRYTDLASLTSGVAKVHEGPVNGGSEPTNGNTSGLFSVNGTRGDQNNFVLDGIQNNSNDNGDISFLSSPDAIAEFKIQTTNYSAEFGRSAGGVVNATTKSGANAFHGEVFEFLRNEAIDARGEFEPAGEPKAPYKQNQFGGTLGGPIKKDKTFFFVDYQGTRIHQANTYHYKIPTMDERVGNFTQILDLSNQTGTDALGRPIYQGEIYDPSTTQTVNGNIVRNGFGFDPTTGAPTGTANMIPAGSMSQLALNVLQLYPNPTSNNVQGNNYVVNKPATNQQDQFDVRIDQNVSTKTQIFGRYSFDKELRVAEPPFPGIADGGSYGTGTRPLKAQGAVIGWTQTLSPTKVNSLRLGFNRVHYIANLPAYGQVYPSAGLAVPGQPDDPAINGLAVFSPSTYRRIGEPTYTPTWSVSQQFVLNDTFSWIHGRQTIKMGPQIVADQFNLLQIGQPRGNIGFSGQFTAVDPGDKQGTGNSVADMLVGLPNSARISTVTYFGNRQKVFGGFVQDTYKATDSLTLDLGLRYDYVTPLGEAHNRIANFWYPTGQIITAGTQGYPSNVQVTDKKDFAPRVGIAYSPFSSQKLVFRAGYGRFYSPQEIRTGDPLQVGYNLPFFYEPIFTSDGLTPSIVTLTAGWPSLNPATAVEPSVTSQDWYPHNPVVDEWNVNVQYELPGQVLLTGAYVGNKATHLQVLADRNQLRTPGSTFDQSLRPYPQYGPFTSIENHGNSTFESFQLTMEKRTSHGLYILSAFTYGKAIDDQPPICCNSPWPQDSYNLKAEKGLADFDNRARWVTSFDYAIPVGQGQKFLIQSKGLDYVLGGWHLGGIVTFRSGFPFSPQIDTDQSNTGTQGLLRSDRIGNGTVSNPTPDLWFNINDFPVPAIGTFGNAGKNILEGPGEKSADISLRKYFNFTERYRLEFRAEFYNAFNHPVFSQPDPFVTDGPGSAGVITSTVIPQRQVQMALKLHF
ncbi:MAG TPA: carboxypeptidase regulatory-like domain-containing protein [Terriglobia bacterium]|nr:carboxypeptidase regulatory-like domain-containing protein [Terriglobia bacterium]